MFHLYKDVVHVAVTGSLFMLLYVLQYTYSYGLQIATVLAARVSSVLTCKDHDVVFTLAVHMTCAPPPPPFPPPPPLIFLFSSSLPPPLPSLPLPILPPPPSFPHDPPPSHPIQVISVCFAAMTAMLAFYHRRRSQYLAIQ